MEKFTQEPTRIPPETLAQHFKDIEPDRPEYQAFTELEHTLEAAGFEIADGATVVQILHDSSLICRSEKFTRAMQLIADKTLITLKNIDGRANACATAGTDGYRTAMEEGFSGSDVGNHVKVVLTFKGNNLEQNKAISSDSELWQLKPKTAEVSLAIKGSIAKDDVELISFRFPIHFYPESKLSDDEYDMLDNDEIKFIVRHYAPKKTAH